MRSFAGIALLQTAFVVTALLGHAGTSRADPITVCLGAGCSTANVTGSITAGNGIVVVTANNNLTNSQVVSIIQDVSAFYFEVSGYGGAPVSLSSSSSTQSTTIANTGIALLAGPVDPTGWTAGHAGSTITACTVCAFGLSSASGLEQTLIGGTGSGTYANANGSIAGNPAHNPFLVGTLSLTLNVPGVTANSTFSNVIVQFGTTPTPPVDVVGRVPEPAPLALLALGLGGLVLTRRSQQATR